VQALGLVFVAVYQKTLALLYVDDLLAKVGSFHKSHLGPSGLMCKSWPLGES
jgi:Signal recognition particle, alpha subunit, N-terminal